MMNILKKIKKAFIALIVAAVFILPVQAMAYTYNPGPGNIGAFYSVQPYAMAYYNYATVPGLGGRYSPAHIVGLRQGATYSYAQTYYPHISRPYVGYVGGYYGRYNYLVARSGQSGYRSVGSGYGVRTVNGVALV